MFRSILPLFILAGPFIEIAGFIIVGSEIGVLATLGLIVLSAVLGFVLLRIQGISLLKKIKAETAAGRVPDREMVHGAMLVLAAILLIIPGFVSSTIGLLLFLPPVRDFVWKHFVRNRMIVATSANYSGNFYQSQNSPHNPDQDNNIIDIDPSNYTTTPSKNSPWRNKDDQNDRNV